jgi:hypothetical protein
LKLLWMENPVKGVFSVEFIGPCHINADIRPISTESSPDFSSTLTEGDGRTPIISRHEMGPAKRAADHPKWERSFAGRWTAFPKRAFHRHEVIPQGGDEAVLEGFVGTWHGCIEDGSPSMNETHGMNG